MPTTNANQRRFIFCFWARGHLKYLKVCLQHVRLYHSLFNSKGSHIKQLSFNGFIAH